MNKSVERANLLSLLDFGLESVQGRAVVRQFLRAKMIAGESIAIFAVGKAAFSMLEGAYDVLGNRITSGLLITKDGHLGNTENFPNIECLLAAHPVPDERSLCAGDRLIEWLASLPVDIPLLVLISGGASALVEKLPSNLGLSELQRLNQWLLSSGLPIDVMNNIRRSVSLIKGGGLAGFVGERQIIQLLISDVAGDDPAIIGSGLLIYSDNTIINNNHLPGWLTSMQMQVSRSLNTNPLAVHNIQTAVIANNGMACEAVRQMAVSQGYKSTIVSTELYGDIAACAQEVMSHLDMAENGCYIWGGETTVQLPVQPGRGGRNQHLALLLAKKIRHNSSLYILCAGTDGTDGPTEDAGALVDSQTIARGELEGIDVDIALAMADAGSFLEASGDLVNTGPTGTNVMDLVIALKV